MKTISKLKSVLVLMVFAAAIFSCSDSNETDYTGVNSIYVKTSEAPVTLFRDGQGDRRSEEHDPGAGG